MQKKAFTLTELLVVVVIIGVLSAVVLPKFTKMLETRKVTEAENIMTAVRNEQEARCTLDKDYTGETEKLASFPKTGSKHFSYTLDKAGITATGAKYTLKIPSYTDGRICCASGCDDLSKDYPTCSDLEKEMVKATCTVPVSDEPTPSETCVGRENEHAGDAAWEWTGVVPECWRQVTQPNSCEGRENEHAGDSAWEWTGVEPECWRQVTQPNPCEGRENEHAGDSAWEWTGVEPECWKQVTQPNPCEGRENEHAGDPAWEWTGVEPDCWSPVAESCEPGKPGWEKWELQAQQCEQPQDDSRPGTWNTSTCTCDVEYCEYGKPGWDKWSNQAQDCEQPHDPNTRAGTWNTSTCTCDVEYCEYGKPGWDKWSNQAQDCERPHDPNTRAGTWNTSTCKCDREYCEYGKPGWDKWSDQAQDCERPHNPSTPAGKWNIATCKCDIIGNCESRYGADFISGLKQSCATGIGNGVPDKWYEGGYIFAGQWSEAECKCICPNGYFMHPNWGVCADPRVGPPEERPGCGGLTGENIDSNCNYWDEQGWDNYDDMIDTWDSDKDEDWGDWDPS